MSFAIDGSFTDIATVVFAAVYAILRGIRKAASPSSHENPGVMEGFVADFSYGLSIYPMLLLSGVVFSSSAVEQLVQSNRVLMSLGGFISLVVIIRRSFEKPRMNGSFLRSGFH